VATENAVSNLELTADELFKKSLLTSNLGKKEGRRSRVFVIDSVVPNLKGCDEAAKGDNYSSEYTYRIYQ